jgi:hypothetical protein
VVQPAIGDKAYNKDQGITRRKEFSFDTYTNPPAVLYNDKSLGSADGSTDYAIIPNRNAIWAQDTLSFRQDLMDAIGKDTIVQTDFNVQTTISDFERWQYYRDNFARIIVANLGVLKITWTGYDNSIITPPDPSFVNSERDLTISQLKLVSGGFKGYSFSSPLFKSNTSGSNIFDWNAPTNNFVTNIRASFNDNYLSDNALYIINKMLGVYISPDNWKVHEYGINSLDSSPSPQNFQYYERVFYYPYAGKVINFNVVNFDKQNNTSSTSQWQAAIYPRIIQQSRYNTDSQNVQANSDVKIYEGLWNIDVIIYPYDSISSVIPARGSCNNLVGDLLISYM